MFIAFEGRDNVGKSTQVNLLRKYFIEKGKNVYATREPGGTPLGTDLREIMLKKYSLNADQLMMLMFAERPEHSKLINLYLDNEHVVITDRYHLSSYAYNVIGMDGSLDLYNELLAATSPISPDHWIMMIGDGVSVKTDLDKIESLGTSLQETVNEVFSNIEREVDFPDGVKVSYIYVNNKTIEEVHKEILTALGLE